MGRHRKFTTPRSTNTRKARNECQSEKRNPNRKDAQRIPVFCSFGLSGPTESLAPRGVMGTYLHHFTEGAKPLLLAFASMSCTDTTVPLPYLFEHIVSLYYNVPWRKNLTHVIWYEHLRSRKHFFHDYCHAVCTAWSHVGCSLHDARALPVCRRDPIF